MTSAAEALAVRDNKRSIGEVLALLKQEFADISISKIRFLEGQGLLNPERTASGYRKFTDQDVARLRYILRLQREQFLPLKVIKERLVEQEATLQQGRGAADARFTPELLNSPFSTLIDRRDLLTDSGLTDSQLRDLEKFAMIQSQSTSQGTYYDADALSVARIAARFLASGVDVRHLRGFKISVDREADLYLQMVPPVRNARSPQAAAEAHTRLQELSELGQSMRTELLRQRLNG